MSGEPSSRERGLMLGHTYASREVDRVRLRGIARARNAVEVKAAVAGTMNEPADLDDPVAFWSGFAHGVKGFLVDQGAARTSGP